MYWFMRYGTELCLMKIKKLVFLFLNKLYCDSYHLINSLSRKDTSVQVLYVLNS